MMYANFRGGKMKKLIQWNNGSISICPSYLMGFYKNIEIIRDATEDDYNTYPIHADYVPFSILDTKNVNAIKNKVKWLEIRRMGIGGSESAAARGRGTWKTPLDIYNEKVLGRMEDKIDWVTSAHGHILEPLIQEIFAKKTGYPVCKVERMLRHPFFPFLIADVDGICQLPDGSYAILEIKTTNPWNLSEWKDNCIPNDYMEQGIHYMAVLNLDTVFFICFYGNSSKDVIIRKLDRDFEKEEAMINELELFWYDHILRQVPPASSLSYGEGKGKTYKKYIPVQTLDKNFEDLILSYLKEKEKKVGGDKEKLVILENEIIKKLDGFESVTFKGNGNCYTVSFKKEQPRRIMTAENLELLKFQHPDIYGQYTTETYKKRTLRIKEGRL